MVKIARRRAPPRRAARSCSTGEAVDFGSPGRRQGRRHRGDLPGADAVPRPVRRREHLHGPPAARPRPADRPRRRCTPRPARCSPGSACAIDPRRPARGLSIADQQIVEIAKAISLDAAAAGDGRADRRADPASRSSGCSRSPAACATRARAGLFISHRFEEIFALCDTRHGHARRRVRLHRADRRDAPSTRWSRRMVGREVGALFPKTRRRDRATSCSRSTGLTRAGVFHDVSLHRPRRRDRRPGRPGRRRAAARSCGRSSASTATTPARSARRHAPCAGTTRARRSAPGIALVPEDRRQQGLVMELSVGATSPASSAARLAHARPADRPRRERAPPAPWAGRLEVKTSALDAPSPRCPAATSRRSCWPSGWPPSREVLIVDEPTRGIDVGTKAEVHRLLSDAGRRGRRGADGLLRAARGARHGRPRAGHARGPAGRRARPRRGHTRERVMLAATAPSRSTAEVAERLHHDHEEVTA